ncbi:alpha/beta hydrolase [uncultured Psychrosphaera sp.]|uniref:alpha/beta fold hydrolase n=1 Tax=uncultured Psychrosphaera sp. TaxID=1403522 RepID=UPI00261D2587|nr:alpha/beta hydrolase [uncultured Psychrosphaera sp.]
MNKSFLILVSVLILTFTGDASAQNPVKYNKELDGFDYPFEVNTFEFDSQKQTLKMRYMDIGNKDAEKVVVLLHGKNFAGFYWEDVANDLVSKKYRVLIPDQIGFGKSSKPDAYQYSLGQFALNTKLLLESLKIDNITLVGHSMGGMIATTFAVNYVSTVDKLILINSIGLEDYSKYTEFKDVNFFYKNELGKTVDKARAYQQKIYYAGKWSKEYETLLVPLKGMLAGDDWKVVAWNNALTYGPIFSENIVDRFPQIQSKTYLINGTRDTTGPGRGWLKEGVTRKLGEYTKLGKHTQSLIKDSVLIELEGLGHMPFYEDYPAFIKAFNQAID